MSGRLYWTLRWRLSVLWFLEWGITGAVMTYLPIYWESIRLSKQQQSQLAAVTAVGLWVAPFVVGQVADRWLAIEKLLAISHFAGGVALAAMATGMELFSDSGANFMSLVWLTGIFACAYLPTVPLVTALCFRHLPNPDRQFGKVRVWGTVGWMAASVSLSVWLAREQVMEWLGSHAADWAIVESVQTLFRMLPRPAQSDCFRMSALLSFALASFCVFLPHTPPARSARGSLAPLATLAMFKDRDFSLFIGISFLLAVGVVPLYSTAVPPLLTQLGVEENWVPTVMLIGQLSEFPALLLLSYCLRFLGMKLTFALGIAAWALRYGFFAAGSPWSLVAVGLALHGVCHVFLMVVAQLYIDSKCRQDLRASAQNLLSFVTLGIGWPVGMLLGGWLRQTFEENTTMLFAVPSALALGLLVLFWKTVNFPPVVPQEALAKESGATEAQPSITERPLSVPPLGGEESPANAAW
ncbi:MAG: MFS transporter [Planctomycetales bacterium]